MSEDNKCTNCNLPAHCGDIGKIPTSHDKELSLIMCEKCKCNKCQEGTE